ncbi:hypothetical protein B0T22DRAFT_468004 [Podospora appendiculata]|uniref:Uncharacterized protein n=1 Tax=Podospora appendiculata TaxID=314037 RepID=A0AAE0X2W2_9PEZI|nr:hypothetical protein B0T22DRAFT_468004 [Podospora appendiculata]
MCPSERTASRPSLMPWRSCVLSFLTFIFSPLGFFSRFCSVSFGSKLSCLSVSERSEGVFRFFFFASHADGYLPPLPSLQGLSVCGGGVKSDRSHNSRSRNFVLEASSTLTDLSRSALSLLFFQPTMQSHLHSPFGVLANHPLGRLPSEKEKKKGKKG